MRPSVVKAKLREGKPVVGVSLSLTDPVVFEMASLLGFDFIWLDMEHHAVSVETAGNLMRAARVGRSDIMCRPANGEFMRMGRMLEFGAHGIMYPRCRNAEEAREVVKWAKFAPQGTRGIDTGNADNPYCFMSLPEYIQYANDETWIVIQLEDPASVEHAEEIAAVDGVDVLMLGPGDYSIFAGVPGQFNHPKVDEALRHVAAAAKKHGKAWGTPGGSPQRIRELIDRGAQWTTCGSDMIFVKNALEQARRELAELGLARESPVTGRSYQES